MIKKVNGRSVNNAFVSSCTNYGHEAVKIIEKRSKELYIRFPSGKNVGDQPFSNIKYQPELDMSLLDG